MKRNFFLRLAADLGGFRPQSTTQRLYRQVIASHGIRTSIRSRHTRCRRGALARNGGGRNARPA